MGRGGQEVRRGIGPMAGPLKRQGEVPLLNVKSPSSLSAQINKYFNWHKIKDNSLS